MGLISPTLCSRDGGFAARLCAAPSPQDARHARSAASDHTPARQVRACNVYSRGGLMLIQMRAYDVCPLRTPIEGEKSLGATCGTR